MLLIFFSINNWQVIVNMETKEYIGQNPVIKLSVSNHLCQNLVHTTYRKKYQCQVPLHLGTRQTYLTCTCPKPGIHWPVAHVSPLYHINWHFIVFVDLYTVICLRGIKVWISTVLKTLTWPLDDTCWFRCQKGFCLLSPWYYYHLFFLIFECF